MKPEFNNDYESMLHDVSVQMASSQLSRRNSRSSKRHSGTPSRRSIRIEKPPTVHNSPRILERRRTTTSVKRYASLDDHYNAMFGSPEPEEGMELIDAEKNAVRPVSWHPSASTAIRSGMRNSHGGRESAGVPNVPRPYTLLETGFKSTVGAEEHAMQDNCIPTANTMSPEDAGNLDAALWHRYATTSTWPIMSHVDPYLANSLAQFANAQEWAFATTSSPHRDESPQAYASSDMQNDYLPIQNPLTASNTTQPALRTQRSKDSSRSLVGMGLYDPPEPVLDSWRTQHDGYHSWLAPELVESRGKGLKLEETFEPPPDNDEDIEDGEEEDNGSSEDEVQEDLPTLDEPQLRVTVASSAPTNLAGQSFFFDDDDTYSNEWWYGQTKHGSAPDAAALNCGWI